MPPRIGSELPSGAVAGPATVSSAAAAAAAKGAAGASGAAQGPWPPAAGGSGQANAARLPAGLSLHGVRPANVVRRELPSELWLYIFSFLDARTLACHCSTVSRYWSSLVLEAIKDREYAQHETFMLTHSRVNIGAHRFCRDLNAMLSADDVPIVVSGDAGSGKSSMLTQWILDYHRTHTKSLVLYHFVGSPAHSTDYMNVLHRFMLEIKNQCPAIAEDVPSTATNLQKKLPQWLSDATRVFSEGVILVIDGLTQLDDKEDAHSLNWLPEKLPPKVKLIVSLYKPSRIHDICVQQRRWKSFAIPPLSSADQAFIIRRMLRGQAVQLSPAQRQRIMAARQATNPLYLTILLEYLACTSVAADAAAPADPESVDRLITHYLKAPDALSLYIKVIERLEGTYGQNVMRDILTSLYVARSGLSEAELQDFLRLDNKTWLAVYAVIASSLMMRFGLLGFFHDLFRQAVAVKYLSTEHAKQAACRRLASYFQSMLAQGNITVRVVDELPWLLERAGDREALKLCISHIRLFDKLFQKERKYDLFRYWVAAGAQGPEIAELYTRQLAEFEQQNQGNMKEVARLAHKIGEYIRDGGHYNEAVTFFDRALAIKKAEYGEDAVEVATTMNELGRLYFRLGRNEETLAIWKRALEIRERAKGGKEDHDIAISLNNLALIYEKMGRWQEAEPTYKRALEIYKQVSGPDHPDVAITYHNLGLLYSSHNNRLADSEEMYMKALAIKEKYYGKDHNELAMTLNNLGLVYSKSFQHAKATELYKKAIAIRESIFGPDHPDVALFLFNLGVCYGKMNRLDLAKPCLYRALKIRKRVYGPHHQSTHVVRSWVQYFNWPEEEE